MTRALLLAALTLLAAPAVAKPKAAPTPDQLVADAAKGVDQWATLQTSMGDIVVKLYTKEAPLTAGNFVALATGQKEWTHPGTKEHKAKGTPYYDNTLCHRVIAGFMMQCGDPSASGMGNPGWMIPDENQKPIDRPGLLAMANAGPNTSGSQFYITETPQPRLQTYNLFGEVVKGMEVVVAIGHTPTDRARGDRPLTDVVIKKIVISESAPK